MKLPSFQIFWGQMRIVVLFDHPGDGSVGLRISPQFFDSKPGRMDPELFAPSAELPLLGRCLRGLLRDHNKRQAPEFGGFRVFREAPEPYSF